MKPGDRAAGTVFEEVSTDVIGPVSFAVIGMAGIDRPGPIELLGQQYPGERVRQRQRRQSKCLGSLSSDGVIHAVRAADHDRYRLTVALPGGQPRRQSVAVEIGSALIEQHHPRTRGQGVLDALRFAVILRLAVPVVLSV